MFDRVVKLLVILHPFSHVFNAIIHSCPFPLSSSICLFTHFSIFLYTLRVFCLVVYSLSYAKVCIVVVLDILKDCLFHFFTNLDTLVQSVIEPFTHSVAIKFHIIVVGFFISTTRLLSPVSNSLSACHYRVNRGLYEHYLCVNHFFALLLTCTVFISPKRNLLS